jgi:hypothetical protein
VDDTTTGTTYDDVTKDPVPIDEKEMTSDEESMVKRMEDIIQFFLDLIQVTGGDLAPYTCVWYLIAHIWKKDVPALLANKTTHRGIVMKSKATGTISAFKRKAISQGHRTLGLHLCGKKLMKENAIKYGEAIQSISFKRGNLQWITTGATR